MRVILREAIQNLGTVGDEVTVANGYARNYLLPQNKAILATAANRRLIELDKTCLELKVTKDRSKAEAMAKTVQGALCTIAARVSEEDNLYGSVSTRDIADNLKAQGHVVDRRMVLLSEPIKTLGSYIVPIQLHPEVTAEISVKVVAEQEES
jgi:large subunit ribosomal protein L9